MSEEQLQAECFQWFDNTFPELRRTLFAVPNGGLRPTKFISGRYVAAEGNKLKATGVVAGTSDLIWVLPQRIIFIEMKLPGKGQSVEQEKFQDAVEERGHLYVVIDSFKDFQHFIIRNLTRSDNL
jgi:hypothetical protein